MNAIDLCHHYAAQPNKDRKAGNLSIQDGTLYSYAAPIAHLTGNPTLPLLISERTYSVTTAKHLGFARRALHHVRPAMEVQEPRVSGYGHEFKSAHIANIRRLLQNAHQHLSEAARPRIRETTRAAAIVTAVNYRDQAETYRQAFRVPLKDLPKDVKARRTQLARINPADAAQAIEVHKRHLAAAETRRQKAIEAQEKRRAKQEAERAKRDAETLDRWTAGEPIQPPHHYAGDTRLRVRAGLVETSHGANVPAADAWRLWPIADRARRTGETYDAPADYRVGIYRLDHVSPQGARIGCHFIPFAEMERIKAEVEAAAQETPATADA